MSINNEYQCSRITSFKSISMNIYGTWTPSTIKSADALFQLWYRVNYCNIIVYVLSACTHFTWTIYRIDGFFGMKNSFALYCVLLYCRYRIMYDNYLSRLIIILWRHCIYSAVGYFGKRTLYFEYTTIKYCTWTYFTWPSSSIWYNDSLVSD